MDPLKNNPTIAMIHGLSIQAGAAFRDAYESNQDNSNTLLDAYVSLRRALPLSDDGERHIGYPAAYSSTQWSLRRGTRFNKSGGFKVSVRDA